MIITLMYHKIVHNEVDSDLKLFLQHIEQLNKKFRFVVPGECHKKNINVCLLFDDAYCDFYLYVYPILKKYNIKAVLAVPTGFIAKSTKLASGERLQLLRDTITQDANNFTKDAYCNWQEINEMVGSGLVQVASHGHHHSDLSKSANLHEELVKSKEIIKQNTQCDVGSFVYPYGKFNHEVHKEVQTNYKYIFRIGNALNFNWNSKNNLYYRMDAEPFWLNSKNISKLSILKLFSNFLLNKVRQK